MACLMTGKVVGMLATEPEDAIAAATAAGEATATYTATQIAALMAFAVGIWEVGRSAKELWDSCPSKVFLLRMLSVF